LQLSCEFLRFLSALCLFLREPLRLSHLLVSYASVKIRVFNRPGNKGKSSLGDKLCRILQPSVSMNKQIRLSTAFIPVLSRPHNGVVLPQLVAVFYQPSDQGRPHPKQSLVRYLNCWMAILIRASYQDMSVDEPLQKTAGSRRQLIAECAPP